MPGAVLAAQAGDGEFPLILRLNTRDSSFKQYIADVEANRKLVFRGDSRINLTIYRYTPGEGEDIFFLAARCNVPYSALASLNRMSNPSMVTEGVSLLLPSVPGIFVPKEPQSDIENLMASSNRTISVKEDASVLIGGTAFYFFPGDEFAATERAFFLNTGFRFPLKSYRLTSGYGMRRNPFSGNMRLHQGLDLAAPAGTEVYAAGDGIVAELGEDLIYGNYIIIKHSGGWASLYAHLQKAGIGLNAPVKSGMLIGWVGSTGQSTGPHLHFELRQNGRAQNPDKHLFMPRGP